MTEKGSFSRPLTIAILFYIAPLALIITLPNETKDFSIWLIAISFIAALYYLVSLWNWAKHTGRSPIVWAGLTLITSPFGYIISYLAFLSKEKIRDES